MLPVYESLGCYVCPRSVWWAEGATTLYRFCSFGRGRSDKGCSTIAFYISNQVASAEFNLGWPRKTVTCLLGGHLDWGSRRWTYPMCVKTQQVVAIPPYLTSKRTTGTQSGRGRSSKWNRKVGWTVSQLSIKPVCMTCDFPHSKMVGDGGTVLTGSGTEVGHSL